MARDGAAVAVGALDGDACAGCRWRTLSPVGNAGPGTVPQGAAAAADRPEHQGRWCGDDRGPHPRWQGHPVVTGVARGGEGRDRPGRTIVAQGERRYRFATPRRAGRQYGGPRDTDAVDARRALQPSRLRLSFDCPEPRVRRQDRVRQCPRRGKGAAGAVATARAVEAARGGGNGHGRYRGRYPAQYQPRRNALGHAETGARRAAGAAQRQA